MPATALKDYYKTLELHPTATGDEVRSAYRKLARKYHPDINQDNPYAVDYFREVKEAYEVLREPSSRARYDEDRWLSGMSTRAKDATIITPNWIYLESKRLAKHMATVDSFRMNHKLLHDYVHTLLSDSHMAVLHQERNELYNSQIIEELLYATLRLKYEYTPSVNKLLQEVAMGDADLLARIAHQEQKQKRQHQWLRSRPLLIIIIVLILCVFMFIYARK